MTETAFTNKQVDMFLYTDNISTLKKSLQQLELV